MCTVYDDLSEAGVASALLPKYKPFKLVELNVWAEDTFNL